MKSKSYQNRHLYHVLAILGTAVACAGIVACLFLYYYGPTGRYLAEHTLVDPYLIEKVEDKRKKSRFILDSIEFSYVRESKQLKKSFVSLEAYQNFYKKVASEKSLKEPAKKIENLFLQSLPATLSIRLHTLDHSEHVTAQFFQIMQCVPEDFFRVQLNDKECSWVYFYQEGIYQEMVHLFISSVQL